MYLNVFKLLATPTSSRPLQPTLDYSNPLQATPTVSRLLQPTPGHSNPLQVTPILSNQMQVTPTHSLKLLSYPKWDQTERLLFTPFEGEKTQNETLLQPCNMNRQAWTLNFYYDSFTFNS